MRLEPASSLTMAELARLFTASYEGYLVPVSVDEAALRGMVETLDVDLDGSRVAYLDGEPAGLANLAVRGDRAWIAGMGVVARARRRGLGEALMRAVLDVARARGVREAWLEVIEGNDAARTLYEKLGFEWVRDLEIWSLDASTSLQVGEVPYGEALARVRELRDRPAPWQCAEETLARHDDVRGFAVDGAAALARGTVVLQVAGDEPAVTALLGGLGPLRAFNVPEGPATRALAALGGRRDLRQHELALGL